MRVDQGGEAGRQAGDGRPRGRGQRMLLAHAFVHPLHPVVADVVEAGDVDLARQRPERPAADDGHRRVRPRHQALQDITRFGGKLRRFGRGRDRRQRAVEVGEEVQVSARADVVEELRQPGRHAGGVYRTEPGRVAVGGPNG